MSELSGRRLRAGAGHRPLWMGWSIAVVVLAVASIAVAAGASERGAGVPVPPAIDIGTGVVSHATPTAPPTTEPDDRAGPTRESSTTSTSTVDRAAPTTVPLRTTNPTVWQQTAPSGDATRTPSTSPVQSGSGSDGKQEQGDPPTTVTPNYPVITGTTNPGDGSGGSDS